MKKKLLNLAIFIFGIALGIILRQNKTTWVFIKKPFIQTYLKYNDKWNSKWSNDFKVVEIKSDLDDNVQRAYFYKSKSENKRPLIVSLHTWGGNYIQYDELSELCKMKDLNYIHPDFRGSFSSKDGCCGELAISDIDQSITYALNNANIDTTNIFVIGVSGGGYATLSTFMKSQHNIKKFSAWASISDVVLWYGEKKIRVNNFGETLEYSESKKGLNDIVDNQKSPIYWNTPIEKLLESKLFIYAGIYDGIQGNVPITQSINFYNKVLSDLSVSDSSKYVSEKEKLELLEFRNPLSDSGSISGRKICLKKEFKNIKLIIFEGNHEMLMNYALDELIE